jgi:hypothetical protein
MIPDDREREEDVGWVAPRASKLAQSGEGWLVTVDADAGSWSIPSRPRASAGGGTRTER